MNGPRKPWTVSPPAPGALAPAWADPRAIMYTCATRVSEWEVNMFVPTEILRADPTRVAFGILRRTTENQNVLINPGSDPNDYAWIIGTTGAVFWLTLFDFGPLICGPWVATSQAQALLQVVELYRQQ
jgi:hypothetical protein